MHRPHLSCILSFLLALASWYLSAPTNTHALEKPGTELQDAGVRPILGNQVPLDTVLVASDGSTRPLSYYVKQNRPLIIVPAYYGCPRLCGLIHQGVINLLKELTLTLGDDYTVATISFDPTETTAQALEHAQIYRSQYADPEKAARGWEFFVGEEVPVKTLLNEVGFYYKKDGEEYAHSAAIFILTPEGKISQYFTGIEFPPFDVKLALLEAAQGQIGTPLDHILLFCFRFDDTKGRYTLAAYNTMRAGGALTLMFLVLVIGTQIVRERRKKRMDSMRSGKL